MMPARQAFVPSLVAGIVMLGIYLGLAPRFPVFGDSPELMAASIRLGIAHPTGYPLLLLLGKLASLVPAGTIAYRLNALSGLAGSLACAALCFLLCRAFGSQVVACIVTVVFGLSTIMWQNCTQFEVYSLDALFLSSSFLLAHEVWGCGPVDLARRHQCFRWLALTAGLGVSHHLTFVAALPAAGWMAFSQRARWRPGRRDILAAAGLFAVGLLPWLYLPIRGRFAFDLYTCWVPLRTLRELYAHVVAEQYGDLLSAWAPAALPLLLRRSLHALWEQFGPLLLFAPVGLACLRASPRAVVQAAIALIAVNMTLFVGYAVEDYSVFYIPAYLGTAILIAAGLRAFGWQAPGALSTLRKLLTTALALALLLWQVPARYRACQPIHFPACMDSVNRVLGETSADAVLLVDIQWHDLDYRLFPFRYAKRVEGLAQALDCINAAELGAPPLRNAFMDLIAGSPDLQAAVRDAPPATTASAFVRAYDGQRPLYVNGPRLLTQSGSGGELLGFTWRVTGRPGLTLAPAAAAALAWADRQLAQGAYAADIQRNVAAIFLNHAYYYLLTGQFREAQAMVHRMVRSLPASEEALFHAAGILSRCGDARGAARLSSQLKQLAPYSARGHLMEAILLNNAGHHAEALRACRRAWSIDRINAGVNIRFERARAYMGLGDTERAHEEAGPELWQKLRNTLPAAPALEHRRP